MKTEREAKPRVLELMRDGVLRTCPDIAAALGMKPDNIPTVMCKLKAADMAHVHSWVRNSMGQPIRRWVIGKGRDTPRPSRITRAERRRRECERQKQRDQQLARERLKPAVVRRDPMVAALFGEYARA